jgi:Glyoxalase-like domain
VISTDLSRRFGTRTDHCSAPWRGTRGAKRVSAVATITRVALAIDCVLIDCVDLEIMTVFWGQTLGLKYVWTGPSGGHLLAAVDGSVRRLGLMPGRANKTAKNRVHFDLRPDNNQQDEVRRLEALGATRVDVGQADVTWVVMADPEGNEFCVLRSLAEKERSRNSD